MGKSISELLRVCGTDTEVVLIGDFRNGITDRSHGRSLTYRGFHNHIVDSWYTKVITRTDSKIKIIHPSGEEHFLTPAEYAKHEKDPRVEYDFSEFDIFLLLASLTIPEI